MRVKWGWNEIERHSANEVWYVEKSGLLEKTKEKLEIGKQETKNAKENEDREKKACAQK